MRALVGGYGAGADVGETVRVVVRLRPPPLGMESSAVAKCKDPTSTEVRTRAGETLTYRFDLCCHPGFQQLDVWRLSGVRQLLDSVLDGFSATIFAYGPTGSGKTYTMSGLAESGSDRELDEMWRGRERASLLEQDGIVPRAVHYLFDRLRALGKDARVRASYAEIYNEHVYDLLNVQDKALPVRQNALRGFYCQGLLELECLSLDDVMEVVREGSRNRRRAAHDLNQDSSRSHSILTLHVQTGDGGARRLGKACFVDLAGSERLKQSRSLNVAEVASINRSLFVLAKVMSALADEAAVAAAIAAGEGRPEDFGDGVFVPYRDSTLTMLLKDALGGASRTLMFCCLNPCTPNADEAQATLAYANRVRDVTNAPLRRVDARADAQEALEALRRDVAALREENKRLRDREAEREDGGATALQASARRIAQLEAEAKALRERVGALEGQRDALQRRLDVAAEPPPALRAQAPRPSSSPVRVVRSLRAGDPGSRAEAAAGGARDAAVAAAGGELPCGPPAGGLHRSG